MKLETRHLTYEIDGQRLVDDVSLAVETGETVAVVGPSGAGKSSFLRLLNRLDEPTGGTVRYEGADYHDLDPQTLRVHVGLVPQDAALVEGTVFENVTLGPRLRGEPVDRERAQALLQHVGLADLADQKVETVSGGEAQRIALARTLMNDPDVLLLDEPTASLDADTEAAVEALLRDLIAERSLTCVLVTHDEAQAHRLATRVLEFDDGRLVDTYRTERIGVPTGGPDVGRNRTRNPRNPASERRPKRERTGDQEDLGSDVDR